MHLMSTLINYVIYLKITILDFGETDLFINILHYIQQINILNKNLIVLLVMDSFIDNFIYII